MFVQYNHLFTRSGIKCDVSFFLFPRRRGAGWIGPAFSGIDYSGNSPPSPTTHSSSSLSSTTILTTATMEARLRKYHLNFTRRVFFEIASVGTVVLASCGFLYPIPAYVFHLSSSTGWLSIAAKAFIMYSISPHHLQDSPATSSTVFYAYLHRYLRFICPRANPDDLSVAEITGREKRKHRKRLFQQGNGWTNVPGHQGLWHPAAAVSCSL